MYRGILEKHADLIRAVMAQRKKRTKPAPAITGGEAIEAANAIENGATDAVGPEPTSADVQMNDGTNTNEDATVPDTEMAKNASAVTAATPEGAASVGAGPGAIDADDPQVPSGIQEVVDDAIVIDTDHSDSAQVENTI